MTHKQKTKVDELRDALKKRSDLEQRAAGGKQDKSISEGGSNNCNCSENDKAAEDLMRQIQSAEEEAKGHYDKLLRVMAEFENFKKRISKEQEEQIKYGNEKLLAELLPTIDNLDRVLDHIPIDASEDVKKIAEGVDLVRKSLVTTLEKFGLKETDGQGAQFDPAKHEAIAMVASEGYEAGQIVAVHRKGYFLADRLIRPAMVSVAKVLDS